MKGMINFLKISNYVLILSVAAWAAYFIFANRPPETLDKFVIGMLVFRRIQFAMEENKYLDAFEETNIEGDTKNE